MDDNDVMYLLMKARSEKKQRLKGYYICPECGEFIKNIARPFATCPFCLDKVGLVMTLSSELVQVTTSIWKDSGIYSPLRADEVRKECA